MPVQRLGLQLLSPGQPAHHGGQSEEALLSTVIVQAVIADGPDVGTWSAVCRIAVLPDTSLQLRQQAGHGKSHLRWAWSLAA